MLTTLVARSLNTRSPRLPRYLCRIRACFARLLRLFTSDFFPDAACMLGGPARNLSTGPQRSCNYTWSIDVRLWLFRQ
jgi:hypothetical protein